MARPHAPALAAAASLAAAGAGGAQPAASPASLAALDSTVAAYCAAWGTADRAARDRLLERVWAPDGAYSDPAPTHAEGRGALSETIDRLQRQLPGARFRCGAAQAHHGFFRFGWVMLGADGGERLRGTDFGELDAEGRIRRIVGFFGPPPEPDR